MSESSSFKGRLSSAINKVKNAAALKLPSHGPSSERREQTGRDRRSMSVGNLTTNNNKHDYEEIATVKDAQAISKKKRLLKALTPRARRRRRSTHREAHPIYTSREHLTHEPDVVDQLNTFVDDTNTPSSIARLQEMKQQEALKKSATEPSSGLKTITKRVSQATIKRNQQKQHHINHLTNTSPKELSNEREVVTAVTDVTSDVFEVTNVPHANTEKDVSYRETADDPTYSETTSKMDYDDSDSERTNDEVTTPREKKSTNFVPSLSLASAQQIQNDLLASMLEDSGSASTSSASSSNKSGRKPSDDSIESLIHQYASLNKADKLRELLNRERDRLRKDEDDDLALKTLFSDVVNCVDPRDQSTALHKAAAKNNCEVLELLLKEYKETRIDARDNLESTALHWACSNSALEAIFILCKFGASINVRDKYGYGPLHLTIKKKCYRGADVLLLYNADINFKMSSGSTALHWACENNEMDIIKWLLTKDKINYNCRDKLKETPILRAASKGNNEVVEYLMKRNLVDWKMRDDKLQSLLHKAAYNGSNDLIMRIANINPVACNAMMNEKDRDGNTPLHLAVKKDHFRAIKSLCMMGAEMDIQNKHGDTPLHISIMLKDYKTARYLYQSGASVDIKNKKGNTARQLTEQQSKTEMQKSGDSFKKNEDPAKLFT